jgi:hypothetical protein
MKYLEVCLKKVLMMRAFRSSARLRIEGRLPASRRMGIEQLEKRSLLAGDCFHNFLIPEDTNGNGSVDPLDALVIINQLNRGPSNEVSASNSDALRLVDVDADRSLSPLDALMVINQLNADAINSDSEAPLASRVDMDRRIERIERAIASNALPPNFTVDEAQDILETLRSGGRPELGDRVVDGVLQWVREVEPISDETDTSPDDSTSENSPSNLKWFVDAVSERLAAFGVTQEVIQTIGSEMKEAYQAGVPMDIAQIRDRLIELGVDVNSILPAPIVISPIHPGLPDGGGRPELPGIPDRPDRPDLPDRPDEPIMPALMVTQPIAEAILRRLTNARVPTEIVDTISREMWAAIDAGRPLDLRQVRSRLEELGVNWDDFSLR